MVLTRKRAADDLRQRTEKQRPDADEPPVPPSSRLRLRTSEIAHHSEGLASEDITHPILDDPEVKWSAALSFLEQHRVDLMCWTTINPEEILWKTHAIWQNIHVAKNDYIHVSGGSRDPDAFTVVTPPTWDPDVPQHRPAWTTTRTILFMESVRDVLRSKVFEDDIVARCRTIAPLAQSADPLRHAAPETYRALEMGHFRRQHADLERHLVRDCEEALERRLGLYSPRCASFLHKVVCVSIWLRFYLLHPLVVYDFDYSSQAHIFHAEAILESQPDSWRPVIPAIKRGSTTITKAMAFCVTTPDDTKR